MTEATRKMETQALAEALEKNSTQDVIETNPALRQLMQATAHLLRNSEFVKDTRTDIDALRKEFDAYKNKAIGIGIGIGFASGGVAAIITSLLKP